MATPRIPGATAPILEFLNLRVLFITAAALLILAVALAFRTRRNTAGRHMLSLVTRVRLRLPPGPGFARGRWVLRRSHGLPAARRTARRTRPGLTWQDRRLGPWRHYATFIGWAHGWIAPTRVYAGFEQLLLEIAPPQRGKSAAAAGRIIDDPGPVVATSIRGDLITATAGLRQLRGTVHVFNPEGAGAYGSTVLVDLVAGCQDMATAVRRAGHMVEATTARGLEDGSFWQDQASMALAAFLHAAALVSGTFREVYRWVLEDSDQPLQILSRHPAAAPGAQDQLSHYLALPDRTRSGISTTLLGTLRFMQVPQVAAMVCPLPGQGFEFAAFLHSQDTLYLVAADAAQSPVPPLFAAIIAEITHLARVAASRPDPPLTLELDEVANLAPIPVAAWATWAAGSGIRMHLYAQSFAQLAERWGPLGAETIWQACDIKIVHSCSSEEALCHKLEEACGTVRVTVPARSGPGHPVEVGELQRVLPFAAVRELPPGRAVVLRGGAPPVIVRTERHWRRADARRLARRGGQPVLPATAPCYLPDPMPGLLVTADSAAALAMPAAASPQPGPQGQNGHRSLTGPAA
jgi:type IV secretion system protein VirD4